MWARPASSTRGDWHGGIKCGDGHGAREAQVASPSDFGSERRSASVSSPFARSVSFLAFWLRSSVVSVLIFVIEYSLLREALYHNDLSRPLALLEACFSGSARCPPPSHSCARDVRAPSNPSPGREPPWFPFFVLCSLFSVLCPLFFSLSRGSFCRVVLPEPRTPRTPRNSTPWRKLLLLTGEARGRATINQGSGSLNHPDLQRFVSVGY